MVQKLRHPNVFVQNWNKLEMEIFAFCVITFEPFTHIKMTVQTSVLWKINIHMVKKWPEMAVKWPFMSQFHFESEYRTIAIAIFHWCNSNDWPLLLVCSSMGETGDFVRQTDFVFFQLNGLFHSHILGEGGLIP